MAATKKWVRKVKTASTFPPANVFTKDAATIARVMASPTVSPKGLGSGIRMIQYFLTMPRKDARDDTDTQTTAMASTSIR